MAASVPSNPTLNTISGTIAAINATTAKSGATYYCGPITADGDIPVYKIASGAGAPGVETFHVFMSPVGAGWGAPSDSNPNGVALLLKFYDAGNKVAVSDYPRYVDAYQFLVMLSQG